MTVQPTAAIATDPVGRADSSGLTARLRRHRREHQRLHPVRGREGGDPGAPARTRRAQDPGFGPHHRPPLPFIEVWEQHLEPHSESTADLVEDARTTTTSPIIGKHHLDSLQAPGRRVALSAPARPPTGGPGPETARGRGRQSSYERPCPERKRTLAGSSARWMGTGSLPRGSTRPAITRAAARSSTSVQQ